MMRSHLTRRVFQRLLSSQPLVHHRSLHGPPRLRPLAFHGRVVVNPSTRRTIFGIFGDQQSRDLREPLLDPGMSKMLELDKRIHLIARYPPGPDLVEAFRAFFKAKKTRGTPVEDFHAVQVLQLLDNLEQRNSEAEKPWLSVGDMDSALDVLAKGAGEPTEVHNRLASALYQAIQSRPGRLTSGGEQERIQNFVSILCKTGHAKEARSIVKAFWKNHNMKTQEIDALWPSVLRGFAREDKEDEIQRTLQLMDELAVERSREVYKVMMSHYARKDNVEQLKKWAKLGIVSPSDGDVWSSKSDFRALLEFCLRNHQLEWGQTVMREQMESPEQRTWDAIFAAAVATGRGVDEIDQMMSVMSRRAQESGKGELQPDIDTFNGLIQFAISINDAYTAERYFSLAEKWDVEPDARTYILQVQYRLMADDLSGAIASYQRLREQEIEAGQDWSVMNSMIQKFTSSSRDYNETISNLAEDLSERRRLFPPETVLALCKYHIKRDEYFLVVDLLHTHAPQYSIAQRMEIRDLLVDITVDPDSSTARAWDTYMIFHQVFDLESRRDVRNKVMTSFFNRQRADLAIHVFLRMAKHPRADTRPDVETYVRAFEGVALTGDAEALEVSHNMLKLDTETEPCTRLYNGLMMAYTSVGATWRAFQFWEDISSSPEGPTYTSLHIVFRACEKAPFGHRQARIIWEKLRQTDLVIRKDLLESYIGALAGSQQLDDAFELIDNMEDMTGEAPDTFTIASLLASTAGVSGQIRMAEWAAERYPVQWQAVQEGGIVEDQLGMQHPKMIDRTLRA